MLCDMRFMPASSTRMATNCVDVAFQFSNRLHSPFIHYTIISEGENAPAVSSRWGVFFCVFFLALQQQATTTVRNLVRRVIIAVNWQNFQRKLFSFNLDISQHWIFLLFIHSNISRIILYYIVEIGMGNLRAHFICVCLCAFVFLYRNIL